MLGRLRVGAQLGLPLLTLGAIVNAVVAPDRLGERLVVFGAMAAVEVVALVSARLRLARRYARTITVAFVVTVGYLLLYLLALSPNDLDVLTAVIALAMIGSTLLYPTGALPQAVIAACLVGGYLAVYGDVLDVGPVRTMNAGITLGVGAVLAVIGAHVLERTRQETFAERLRVRTLASQRRRLMELGHELWSRLSVDHIFAVTPLLAHRVLPAERVVVMSRDVSTGSFRYEGLVGDTSGPRGVGFEWPIHDCLAFTEAFGAHAVRCVPGSPLDPLVLPTLLASGSQQTLCAAIGPPDAALGYVCWSWREARPFTHVDVLAARGVAEQVHAALRAARLYEEARRASQLKSRFVSTMSHELRTPLNVILGYNDMLSDLIGADPDGRTMLQRSRRASLELLELVDGMLELGRLEAGRERAQFEEVDVSEIVRRLGDEMADVARSPAVRLVLNVESPGTFVTDPARLRTILKNLLGNALKFTTSGTVELTALVAADAVRFRVRDTGIGISPADHAAVFEMFRQADGSDTRQYGGSGLGLYIVRSFTELLGGTVTLDSQRHVGSTFTIELPRSPARAAAAPQGAAAA